MPLASRVPLTEEVISGEETTAEYDRYAGIYMQPEYRYFVRKILRGGFRSGCVLDVGTGSGRLAAELAKNIKSGSLIIGLDLSRDMLKKAREKAARSGLAGRLAMVRSSAAGLPFADGTFDLVISYASLHHWRQPEAVIDEIFRVLKENGRMVIRDNRRITGKIGCEFLVRLIGCLMSRKRYLNWRKVILAGYTLPEVEAILKKTEFKYYRLGTDFVNLDLCIEAVKD